MKSVSWETENVPEIRIVNARTRSHSDPPTLSTEGTAMKEDRKIKNVVLIMLDTLQFNYLGCYGNKVVKTPNIDRLARQGFLFENAYSEGLPTVPVRRALMTGRFTLPYGGWQPLAPDDTTVADIMWGKNMQTALVYDTPPMRLPKYGYSRGFDFVSFNPGQD